MVSIPTIIRHPPKVHHVCYYNPILSKNVNQVLSKIIYISILISQISIESRVGRVESGNPILIRLPDEVRGFCMIGGQPESSETARIIKELPKRLDRGLTGASGGNFVEAFVRIPTGNSRGEFPSWQLSISPPADGSVFKQQTDLVKSCLTFCA
jgi:hypothetical protein